MRSRVFGASTLAWAALLGCAASAGATDFCPNGGNLVANCGFEAPGGLTGGTTFWELIAGDKLDWRQGAAHTGIAAGDVDALDQTTQFFAGIETCVEGVAPGELYLFGAWLWTEGGGAFLGCNVNIEELGKAEEPCGGSHVGEFSASQGEKGEWVEFVGKFQADAATQDVLLSTSCADSGKGFSDFELQVDDAFLIPIDVVFHDDFDFHDSSCNWSVSVGGSCEPN